MSRDPDRIPKILAQLGELWMANPDLRLGQIIGNATISYYTEDDEASQNLHWLSVVTHSRKVKPND